MYDIAIIGGGIVGAAAAHALSRYDLKLLLLEKENDVANATSKANSGIIHAGYDPHPGTLMAKLNLRGSALAKELCAALDVPCKQCGSLVLAFSPEDELTLAKLLERGRQNGVEGLAIWDQATLREREPEVSAEAVAALYAPSAAVVSPWEYTLALAETAVRNGAELWLESPVEGISKLENGFALQTPRGEVRARFVLNAAGLHADAVHDMVSAHKFSIIPDRGEYFLLDKSEGGRAKHVLFQCPTKQGKGVLVAPTAHGNLIVGPSNQVLTDAEDVSTTAGGLANVREQSVRSIPSILFRDNIRTFSGVRAAADSVDDFIIEEAEDAPGFFDLAGIKSPGLSAAPAIAEMAVDLLAKAGLALREKENFVNHRERKRFAEASIEEKAAMIRENPAHGQIICRCETVTEGEILQALEGPIPPRSIEAVKRRCNAGMGRCQGGFCGPRVVEILAKWWQVSPLEIPLDKAGTYILTEDMNEVFRDGKAENDSFRNGPFRGGPFRGLAEDMNG